MDPTRTWFRPPATAGDHFALDVPPAESELRFESVAAYLSLNQLLWNQGKRGYRCFNGSGTALWHAAEASGLRPAEPTPR